MYNREQLIAAVKQEIEDVILQYENDNDVTYVDIRLQLVDGTYHIHTGDSQFDTDHRGSFGYGSVVVTNYIDHCIGTLLLTEDEIDKTQPEEYQQIATEIVDEALEDWEQNNMEVEKTMKGIDDELSWNR